MVTKAQAAVSVHVPRIIGFIATYGPASFIFLLPALVNGYPLVFSDTATYVLSFINRYIPVDRPIYYSIFLYLVHWRISLWPVAIAQTAIALTVLAIFLRRSLEPIPPLHLSILIALIGIFTSLPFFVVQIMPDFLTPLMVLSFCTLICFNTSLTMIEKSFLYLVSVAAVCVHQANFMIGAIVLFIALILQTMVAGGIGAARSVAGPFLSIVLGIGLLLAPNIKHHEITITPASSVFLLAKLMDDGVAIDRLNVICPSKHYSICPELPALRKLDDEEKSGRLFAGSVAASFLWDGFLDRAGGTRTVQTYAGSVDMSSIENEPIAFLAASLRGFVAQLVHFKTGDGLFPRTPEISGVPGAIAKYFPLDNHAFRTSLQQTDRLHLNDLSMLHLAVVLASIVVFIGLAIKGKSDPGLFMVAATLVGATMANALVMGTLAPVYDRYQGRVVCLIVVAALILLYDRMRQYPAKSAMPASR